MKDIKFSKKNLLAILAGLGVVLLFRIIAGIFNFLMLADIVTKFSPNDFNSAINQQPYVAFGWFIVVISFLSLVMSGFVVGKITKEKGWIYGLILGILLVTISVILSMGNIKIHTLLAVALTTLGGYLSDFYRKKYK